MPPKKRKLSGEDGNPTDEDNLSSNAKKPANFPIFSKRVADAKVNEEADKSSKALKFDLTWSEHGQIQPGSKSNVRPLIYFSSASLPGRAKIAAFDIDNTLIVTKSGRKWPTGAQDWKWFHPSVPEKLAELDRDSYRILLITNQAGIEKGHTQLSELRTKFEAMIGELALPALLFIATGESQYRKPSPAIWHFFASTCNSGVAISSAESFFVGDAAGRPKNWSAGRPKDFSCADRMFAHNIGVPFHTPEEFFLKQKPASFEWGSLDPLLVLKKHDRAAAASSGHKNSNYHSTEQELVLMLGPPASGKSTFAKRYLVKPAGYFHVNRDTLGTQDKCLKATESALKEGKSVVVDNTNPSRKVRADYVALAKRCGVKKVRVFKMATQLELCHHLNYVRQNHTGGKIRRIPDVGFNMYKNQYEEPDAAAEGLSQVVAVEFEPKFEDKQHEEIFKQWTA